jgi:hypothetical protein
MHKFRKPAGTALRYRFQAWVIVAFLLPVHSAVPAADIDDTAEQQSTSTAVPGGEIGDGDKEASKDDSDRYRLLPIPIFITEPAIGTGLGLALALFHPVKGGSDSSPMATTPASIGQMEDAKEPPPVVTGVFGAYTDNRTWAAGVGHFNNWREDSIRYTGVLGAARINSDFYLLGLPLGFSMEGKVLYQDLKFRLGRSDVFLGAALSYMDADNHFELNPNQVVPEPLLDANIKDVGLAIRGSYDTRNNLMNPVNGVLTELSLWRYDEAIGGNYNYWSGKFKALWFHQYQDKFTLGLRLDVSGVDGRPPFFGYPWVKLRGIPAMRYQNEMAGAIEVEGRFLVAHKWEVLGFAGRGFTRGDVPFFDNPDTIYNFGVGGRYQVLESHKVWMGLDVAKGPEEWAWYIQVGHPW